MAQEPDIAAHYHRSGRLADRILELAREQRANQQAPLRAADLAPFDQLHMGGARSTARLADLAAPAAGALLLDLGAGIAGPARQLAEERQVTVVALDLTESFCQDAAALARAVSLEAAVLPCCGDGTRLPFPDHCFDFVWTQHAAMNVPDKAMLYQETARVLKAGGHLTLHDIMAGPGGPPHFPLPWASSPAQSALLPPEEVRALILASDLEQLHWHDGTAEHLEEQRAERQRRGDAPPDPGPHMLYSGFLDLARNLQRSLREDRARLVTGLFRKPRT
ncbi:MAG TPA: class I SAM-dependent methyltransferase [Kiloniellales bacterium]|nr:class I SAM-dependent methyltransferase [Kiloniellales bacterium]